MTKKSWGQISKSLYPLKKRSYLLPQEEKDKVRERD